MKRLLSVVLPSVFITLGMGISSAPAQSQTPVTTQTRQLLVPATTKSDVPTTLADVVLEFGEPRRISMEELLIKTLDDNLDIKIERFDERIAQDQIDREKGIYDTTLSARGQLTDSTIKNTLDPSIAEEFEQIGRVISITDTERDAREGDVGLTQLLPSGGTVTADTFASRVRLNNDAAGSRLNPIYTRQYAIRITQPLLQGFGPFVTNSQIEIAKLQHQIAQEFFEEQVQRLIAGVLILYWDLIFAINDAGVKELSLQQAQTLLDTNTIKFKAEVLPRVDVLLAEAEVANRQDILIVAKQQIKDVQDQIKKIINIEQGAETWDTNLVPNDRPSYSEYPILMDQYLAEAEQNRQDLQQAKTLQQISEISERVARNIRLPRLDIFGSYGVEGIDDGLSNADDVARTQDYDFWSYGFEFSYPLRNRAARYAHKQAKKQLESDEVNIDNLSDLIVQQVRTATRSIETNRQRIDMTLTSVRAEQAKLDAEQKRYDVGYATSLDLLDFQEDLANAASRHLQAIVNYNKSIIALEQIKGTILETLNIEVDSVNPTLGDY